MNGSQKYIDAFQQFLVGAPSTGGEWRAYCPLHEDPITSNSPSASINFKENVWYCQSCDEGGTVTMLYRTAKNQKGLKPPKPVDNVVDIKTGKPVAKGRPLPSAKHIESWTRKLLASSSPLRFMVDERGISEKTIKHYKLGWDGQRYTIPIFDADGALVNIRRYKPNAKSHAEKMISWGVGHGSARLYGIETLLKHDRILLSEGELDRIITEGEYGIPTVTHTGGSQVFKMEWAELFQGKDVFVAYDDDPQGAKGAMKVASVLKHTARSVSRVLLDTGIKGGDLTNFFVTLGQDAATLEKKMEEAAVLYQSIPERTVATEGERVTLEESQSVRYDKPLELIIMVAGKQSPPYIAPRKLVATCGMTAGAVCAICPLALNEGKREVDLQPDDERLLKFIDATDKRKGELGRDLVEAKCIKHVEIDYTDSYSIEELVVTPSIDHRGEDLETPINRRVYNVGTYKTPVNHTARIVGKQVADPRTSRGTFMSWHLEPVNTDLDNFHMTKTMYARLKRYQTKVGQDPLDKCMEIAKDISGNITKIYGRELLHVAYDLVWHSAMAFDFSGKRLSKGWLECLVMGDTRTGKSEAANALRNHYSSGVIKSCESASFAGLVGGAQMVPGSRQSWIVTWGTIPLNDRRLVILDEMSGLYTSNSGHRESKGILESMSAVRSEGKAQITKIVNEETSARTRLIWMSNPLDDRRLGEQPGSAMGAIRGLIRNPEDIARFDFAIAVASNEVPSSLINTAGHSVPRHRYTSATASDLVMWAWSRKAEDIQWMTGAEDAIYKAAEDMGDRYVPDPPLVQVENIRVKLARLAVAIAARTFSTDARGENILVRTKHVRSAVRFLDTVYGTEAMGYLRHSRRVAAERHEAESHKAEARHYLVANPHVLDVFRSVGDRTFRPRDFEEQGGVDRDEVTAITRQFRAWRQIERMDNGRLRMTPSLVTLLRELEDEGK